MLAIEEDMRGNLCQLDGCAARDKSYLPAFRCALGCLYRAVVLTSHHGAHHSLGTILKLYPYLVAASAGFTNIFSLRLPAALHQCASHLTYVNSFLLIEHHVHANLTYSWDDRETISVPFPVSNSSGSNISSRVALMVAIPISHLSELDRTESTNDKVSTEQEIFVTVLGNSSDPSSNPIYVEGSDAIIHNLGLHSRFSREGIDERDSQEREGQDLGEVRERPYRRKYEHWEAWELQREHGYIFLQSSLCYTRLYAQLGRSTGLKHFPIIASIAGFSGGEYYHWLLEGMPRLLLLHQAQWDSDLLQNIALQDIVLMVPGSDGGQRSYIRETLSLLDAKWGAGSTSLLSRVYEQQPGVRVSADQVVVVDWRPVMTGSVGNEGPISGME
ncbi:unnamed protein product, partial [Choristocarpus tenellus]